MQAEAYDALENYKEVVRKTKECTTRKPDLKSAYLLRITNVLKGINAGKFKDTLENWQKLIGIIDYALILGGDNWGLEQQDLSKISLLKYKAYAFFKQEQYAECQETMDEILQDVDMETSDVYCLYNLILSYVYMKGNETKKCSDTLEEFYFDNDHTLKYLVSFNDAFFKWVKKEYALTPVWLKSLSFSGIKQLHDTCLRWWILGNPLGSYENIERVCQLNSKQRSTPWIFKKEEKLLEHDVQFLLKMAHVLAERGEKNKSAHCLKDLWRFFPATPLSQVIEDEILKAIIIEKLIPKVTVFYDYGIWDNWLRVYNHSPYTLHNIEITILVTYNDGRPMLQFSKKMPSIVANVMFPPSNEELNVMGDESFIYSDWLKDVYPNVEWGGWSKMTKSNIENIIIKDVKCKESDILTCQTKKHNIQRGLS